jgi:magnesium chelatase subunit D
MTGRNSNNSETRHAAARRVFPFTAIVGQEEMKLALLLNVIAPSIGGVLSMGHRGTGKSTAVRALADLLPPLLAVRECAFNCDPSEARDLCDDCLARLASGAKLRRGRTPVPVVELPLGATEDRVCGAIDFGRALKEGVKAFEPGLLARANRGFLYIDEVNLLEDHLVDLLLDVAATGRNLVEREGVSAQHPSRFVLVGSGNPEEGELRPQLLDRFGLCVNVETVRDLDKRVRIVERREAFDLDPTEFVNAWRKQQTSLRRRLLRASRAYARVKVPPTLLRSIAELCLRLGVDGHRGELTIARAARAHAAFEGRGIASGEDVRRVAPMSLRHRLRRDPLEHSSGGSQLQHAVEELFVAPPEGNAHRPAEGNARGSAEGKDATGDGENFSVNPPRSGGNGGGVGRQAAASASRTDDAFERGSNREGEARIVAPSEVGLKRNAFESHAEARDERGHASAAARRRAGAKTSGFVARGRYTGASTVERETRSVALDATLRAAAISTGWGRTLAPAVAHTHARRSLAAEDLRFKRFRGKMGTLYIFLVDTSGSMGANRIGQAKGALALLLRQSYVNRDRVSLITFRESRAELLLAPSGSATRARSLLDALPVGGATPLSAGLLRALELSRRTLGGRARQMKLVIFTDGRANVPLVHGETTDRSALKGRIKEEILGLGAALRQAGVSSLVIDTASRFTANGEGSFLSQALGGRYVQLPQLISEKALTEAVDGV